ncbi:MAG TPA: DUF4230 domain-containing protein [Verrucomicrobiae bacterium]|nr:DUF4230 domain-containing protein [Verrucomicrobiae bacterium]
MRLLKTMAIFALIFLIFATGIWLGSRLLGFRGGPHMENTTTVVQQVQTLNELVTVKYVMQKVVIETAPPDSTLGQLLQGENRLLLLAQGNVQAGINLKNLQPADIVIAGKKIIIHLPPAEITDAYLDEKQTKVIDWQRGFLRGFDKDLETTARQSAVDDIRRSARAAGILKDADDRARLELAVFLNRAGYDQVEFTERSEPAPLAVPR